MDQKADVEERDYAVAAKVRTTDDAGEQLPKSDRLLVAYRICEEAAKRFGRKATLVEEEPGIYVAVLELGDASEQAFDEAAGALIEASSW